MWVGPHEKSPDAGLTASYAAVTRTFGGEVAETLPYMNSTGLVSKILDTMKDAKTPERFSQDYLGTVLGFASGSARPFIPFAKRIGLLNSDGTPAELYHRFRGSEGDSRAAMAMAIRKGYAPLYKRNEYAHNLDRKKLEGHIREITGVEEGSSVLRAMVGTFEALKKYADFEAAGDNEDGGVVDSSSKIGDAAAASNDGSRGGPTGPGQIRFGYTININLPDTNDITVFNAIFRSMKEHLL